MESLREIRDLYISEGRYVSPGSTEISRANFRIRHRDENLKLVSTIKEIKLYEGSNVTLGANPETPFTGFKSLTMAEINDQIGKMIKLLKDGSLTDEGFGRLEIALKQFQLEAFNLGKNSLSEIEPKSITPINDEPNILTSLINVLKK